LGDAQNLALGVPWSALLTPLSTLAMAEASYYSLSFLEPRALKKEVHHVATWPSSASHHRQRTPHITSDRPVVIVIILTSHCACVQTLRGLYTQAHNNLRSIAKSAHELDAISEDAGGSEHGAVSVLSS
jgi:hypothetical protein